MSDFKLTPEILRRIDKALDDDLGVKLALLGLHGLGGQSPRPEEALRALVRAAQERDQWQSGKRNAEAEAQRQHDEKVKLRRAYDAVKLEVDQKDRAFAGLDEQLTRAEHEVQQCHKLLKACRIGPVKAVLAKSVGFTKKITQQIADAIDERLGGEPATPDYEQLVNGWWEQALTEDGIRRGDSLRESAAKARLVEMLSAADRGT